MSEKTFCTIAAVIFTLVALLHLLRIVMGWPAMIGAWSVPMWVSWLGLVVTAALAYFGFRLAKEA
jgi:hypothetical protein